MVNAQVLDCKIKESGLKIGYIIGQLGISRQAFDMKRKGVYPFKAAEIYVLCDLLHIEGNSREAIFFASDSEPQSTEG